VNTRSLKFRLVAWYAGWLTVLFVVFGIFVYASLGHYLEKALREALIRRARQVADTVQRSALNWNVLGLEIQNHFAPEANNRLTRVTVNNVVTYVSGIPADRTFDPRTVPDARTLKTEGSYDRRTLPNGVVLLVAVVLRQDGANRIVVEEGSSVAPLEATLHIWLVALVFGLAGLILIAIFGGFILVQRALQPVDHIIQSAERISSRNLSERLPVAHTRDEIERLSTALNQMIRRLDEGFRQTQRFFADASHELRTPLTIIRGELESVVESTDDKPEVQQTAGSALEEVDRLKNIVEGLFALSRLEAGEAQQHSVPFDLGELASITTEQMALLAEDKNISLVCHSYEKIIVNGDRARLKQVLVNLMDNAIKYTPAGGKIDVNVSTRDGKAVLQVSDNGIGIPTEALPHLFERFFRVDKARSREAGGAGLGLSIVKSICLAHNGRVAAQSKEGEGSCFTVELPFVSQM
jgi:heavy metal sensor kinase